MNSKQHAIVNRDNNQTAQIIENSFSLEPWITQPWPQQLQHKHIAVYHIINIETTKWLIRPLDQLGESVATRHFGGKLGMPSCC